MLRIKPTISKSWNQLKYLTDGYDAANLFTRLNHTELPARFEEPVLGDVSCALNVNSYLQTSL